uniref:Uncharacterized protein n=1 Tax=Kalanchoe fedtschenkoi TaxID=63787 RepID=A0A7N0V298_KALFE
MGSKKFRLAGKRVIASHRTRNCSHNYSGSVSKSPVRYIYSLKGLAQCPSHRAPGQLRDPNPQSHPHLGAGERAGV